MVKRRKILFADYESTLFVTYPFEKRLLSFYHGSLDYVDLTGKLKNGETSRGSNAGDCGYVSGIVE